MIEPAVLAMIKRDYEGAPYGGKTAAAKKWAGLLQTTPQTIYRHLDIGRERKGERKIENLEEKARIIAQLKCSPPDHRGFITTAQAVDNAIKNGLLEPEYADVHIGTWDRVIRETVNLSERKKVVRYQAEYPNQLHHIDGSTSNCFYVHRQLDNGDFVYKLHKGLKDYKNKPVPIRYRPWIYGLTDDNSGAHCFRYVAALGENSADNVSFLDWAWRNREDKALFGLPGKVKGDFGPMMSEEGAKAWLGLCEVDIDGSTPLNKDAHGKIERPWRTLWQSFELPFFMESDWKHFEITQSELNRRALVYQAEYNERPHRWERKYSRLQVWERINLRGGAVALPENALAAFAKRVERTVTQEGVIWVDNVPYEVRGLHDAKVWFFRGIFDDRMSVVDKKTGARYEVAGVFEPNKVGEFTAQPETELQKVRKESAKLEGVRNLLHMEAKPAAGNVTKIPTRVKAVRTIDDPLTLDTYPDVEAALVEFQALCGFFLGRDERAEVKALIEQNKLSKRFVAELALDVQVAQAAAL
uniref:Uncharacterized protein n=1 Tax=Geobacter sp. (strain M21) TaxID=443144 RepID=C6E6U0_GEOSM